MRGDPDTNSSTCLRFYAGAIGENVQSTSEDKLDKVASNI